MEAWYAKKNNTHCCKKWPNHCHVYSHKPRPTLADPSGPVGDVYLVNGTVK